MTDINEKISSLQEARLRILTSASTVEPIQVTGSYDADSNLLGSGNTSRLSSPDFRIVNAPELKNPDGTLNPAGIQARVQADNYIMGFTDAPNLDTQTAQYLANNPSEYEKYTSAMNQSIKDQVANQEYLVNQTGNKDYYGRPLVTMQNKNIPMDQGEFLVKTGNATGTMDGLLGHASFQDLGLKSYTSEELNRKYNSDLIDAAQSGLVNLGGNIVSGTGKYLQELANANRESELNKDPFRHKVDNPLINVNELATKYGKILDTTGKDWVKNADQLTGAWNSSSEMLDNTWSELKQGNVLNAMSEVNLYGVADLLARSLPESVSTLNPVGFGASVVANTNRILDEYMQTNKVENLEDVSTPRKMGAIFGGILIPYLDKLGLTTSIGKNGVSEAIKQEALAIANSIGSTLPKGIINEGVKSALNVLGRVGATAGVEAGTEVLQEATQIGGAELYTNQDILRQENIDRLGQAGLGGFLAGGAMKAGSDIIESTGSKTIDVTKQKLQERVDSIKQQQEIDAINQEAEKPYRDTFDLIKNSDKDLVTNINELIYLSQDLEVEGNTKLQKEVDTYKNSLIEELTKQVQPEESFKFGSSEEALQVMKEIYYAAKDKTSEVLNQNLDVIAGKYKLENELAKIKDRGQVEEEVTVSDKGYVTYENQINNLLKDPENNQGKLTKYINKLEYLKSTQETKLTKLENILKQAEVQFENTDNRLLKFPEYQVRVNKDTGKGQALEINRSDYENFKSGKLTGYWGIVEDTKNTVSNINKILDKPELSNIVEPEIQQEAIIPEYPIETGKYGIFDATKEYTVQELEPLIKAMYPEDNTKPYKPKASKQALEQFMVNNSKVIDQIQKARVIIQAAEPIAETVGKINTELVKTKKQLQQVNKDTDTTELEIRVHELQDKLDTYLDNVEINDVLENSSSNGVIIEPSKKLSIEQSYDSSVNKIVSKSKPTMLSSINVTAFSEPIVKYTNSLVSKLNKILPAVDNSKSKYGNMTEEQIKLRQSPARGLIFDKDGNINKSVALALGASIEDLIKNSGSLLKLKNREEVMRMLDKVYITQDEFNFFKNKGMFLKVVADDLASNIIKHLGLKLDNSIPEELQAKFKADLGNIAVHLAQELGYIKVDQVSLKEFASKLGKEHEYGIYKDDIDESMNIKVSFITLGSKETTMFDTLNQELNIDSDYNRYPSSTPIKNSKYANQVRNNPYNTMNQKVKDALQVQRNTKYVTRNKSINWLNENRDVALKWLGYKTQDEINKLSKVDQETSIAKNDSIVNSLDALKENELTEMYFDFFYTKNNRYILYSTTINPQTDKQLHRWLVVPERHISKYKKDSVEDKELLSIATAQAMGMGIDKKDKSSIVSFGSKLLDMSKKDINLLREGLESGDLSKFNESTELDVEVEHLGHFLEALDVIEVWNDKNTNEIETSISAEFDGLTNGFAIRLVQMPIIKDVYNWLQKVGVFKSSVDNTSMNNVLADKTNRFLDSYQTLADKIVKSNPSEVLDELSEYNKLNLNQVTKILDVLPIKDVNNTITKDLRDLFKNPFMVFNYASSISSIKKSLGYVLRDKIIADMVKGKHTELVNTLGINVRELKTKYPEEIILRNGMTLDNSLREVIEVSYGNQVDKILTDYFAEYIKVNDLINNTFRGMFTVFQDAYQKATKDKVLTKQEKLDEVIKLINLMPGINTVLSKDIREGIAIYDTKPMSPKDLKLGKTQTKLMQDGKEISKAVQGLIKELDAPVSAGAVLPIHSIDGSIMTELMLEIQGIVGIHDAIIPSLRDMNQAIKVYNQKFYELNKNYSILEELVKQVKFTEEYMKANNMDPIVNKGSKKEVSLSDVIKDLKELNQVNNKAREELYSQDLSIGQMVGVDKESLFTTGSLKNTISDLQIEKELDIFSVEGKYIYSSADIEIQDEVLVKYIQDGKEVRDILEYLTTNTDRFISQQAEYLLEITKTFRRGDNKLGLDVEISTVLRDDLDGMAAYNTGTDTIYYGSVESMSNPLVFLHEYTHGLSSKGINYMEAIVEDSKLDNTEKSKMFKTMLKDIDTVLKHSEYFNDVYAFKNRHEVLAEFIANPLFRARLKELPNKDKGLFERILKGVLALFGFKRETLFDLMNRSKDDIFRVNYEVFQTYPEIREEIDLLLTKPEGYTILDKILNKMKEC